MSTTWRWAVALGADRTLVGAWLDDDGANLAGSAYIFRRDDNATPGNPADDFWVEEAKLTASDAAAGDELGKSVSIDGDQEVDGFTEYMGYEQGDADRGYEAQISKDQAGAELPRNLGDTNEDYHLIV